MIKSNKVNNEKIDFVESNKYYKKDSFLDGLNMDLPDLPEDELDDSIKNKIFKDVYGDTDSYDEDSFIKKITNRTPVKKKVLKKVEKVKTEKTEIILAKWPVRKKAVAKKVVKKVIKKAVVKKVIKKKVVVKNSIKLRTLKIGDIKEMVRYSLPKKLETIDFIKGEYTIIRMINGSVKIFDKNEDEVLAKTFMIHTLPEIEGITAEQVKDVKDSLNTKALGTRFLRDVKVNS